LSKLTDVWDERPKPSPLFKLVEIGPAPKKPPPGEEISFELLSVRMRGLGWPSALLCRSELLCLDRGELFS
tara:strand:- start:47 stop:259 length:213 start_codon:yes stop_codon:yes gene_type:complete